MKKYIVLTFLFPFLLAVPVNAEVLEKYIPQELNDSNTKINFDVDSTWHMVEGETSAISGKLWFPENPAEGVKAIISLPVGKFKTGMSMRDSKMRDVMHAEQYPKVEFAIERVENLCGDQELTSSKSCSVIIVSTLHISGVKKSMNIPAKLTLENNLLTIQGKTSIKWKEFNIEDPSIFVAKLDETAVISFAVNLNPIRN